MVMMDFYSNWKAKTIGEAPFQNVIARQGMPLALNYIKAVTSKRISGWG